MSTSVTLWRGEVVRLTKENVQDPSHMTRVLAMFPSEFVKPVEFFFQIKPQIKNRAAMAAHLLVWIKDGSDPIRHLTLADWEWMLEKIMAPEYVKGHNYGEAFGQILADLGTLFEQRKVMKRRAAEDEQVRRERAEEEERAKSIDYVAARKEAVKLLTSLGDTFGNRTRVIVPPRPDPEDDF